MTMLLPAPCRGSAATQQIPTPLVPLPIGAEGYAQTSAGYLHRWGASYESPARPGHWSPAPGLGPAPSANHRPGSGSRQTWHTLRRAAASAAGPPACYGQHDHLS